MYDKIVAEVQSLIESAKGNVTFLTGAGISKTAGIPLASEIVGRIRERFPYVASGIDFSSNENIYAQCMGSLSYSEREDLLSEYFENSRLNLANISLAMLIKKRIINKIMTVNFDNLTERSCSILGAQPIIHDFGVLKEGAFRKLNPRKSHLINLNGRAFGFRLLNDEVELKNHAKELRPLFSNIFESDLLVVIGYSGSSDNVVDVMLETYRGDHRIIWLGYDGDLPEKVNLLADRHGKLFKYYSGIDADNFMYKLSVNMKAITRNLYTEVMDNYASEIGAISKIEGFTFLKVPGDSEDGLVNRRNLVNQSKNEGRVALKDIVDKMSACSGNLEKINKYKMILAALSSKYEGDHYYYYSVGESFLHSTSIDRSSFGINKAIDSYILALKTIEGTKEEKEGRIHILYRKSLIEALCLKADMSKKHDDFRKALDESQKLIAEDRRVEDLMTVAKATLLCGKSSKNTGTVEVAIKLYEEIIKKDPQGRNEYIIQIAYAHSVVFDIGHKISSLDKSIKIYREYRNATVLKNDYSCLSINAIRRNIKVIDQRLALDVENSELSDLIRERGEVLKIEKILQ